VPRDADEYVALQVVACDGPADEFRIGDEPGSAVRVGGGQCVCDADERAALPGVTSDGPGDAFRAVRVGGCQCPAMLTSALPLNALPFQGSSVMDWALRAEQFRDDR
jgi:hypothetical protein